MSPSAPKPACAVRQLQRNKPCAAASSVDSNVSIDPFAAVNDSEPVPFDSSNRPPSGERRIRGHHTEINLRRAASRLCAP
jgi:hypothetical protein